MFNHGRNPGSHWRWLLAYIALFLLFAGAKVHADRYVLNPDAISYLDMAERLVQGHADPLHHPYWSPLYPATLAGAFSVLGTARDSEFAILHLVNWFVFAGVAFAFAYLLTRLWDNLSAGEPALARDRWFFPVWSGFCFALLWHYGSQFLPLATGSPDAIVAAVTFVAAGLACRFWSSTATLGSAALLGIVLALGYYAKAAMLPIGVLLLACLTLRGWKQRRFPGLLAVTTLVFIAASAPLVVAVSRARHHITFSETGKLNYAWSVNDVPPQSGWTGGDASAGTPAHPPRVIVDRPRTLEFARPVPGTQPLWYDPSYWYEGANTHFSLRGQIRALAHDAGFFSDLFTYSLIALTVLVVIAIQAASRRGWRPRPRLPFLVVWPLLVIAMYALVALETRYVVPFLVLFFIGCLQMMLNRRARTAHKAILLTAALLIVLPAAKDALKAASPIRRASTTRQDPAGNFQAAQALGELGLRAGDSIGAVDTGFYFYFAHIAGLRITTAVYEPEAFWKLDAERQAGVLEAMQRTGVRAVVAAKPPSECLASGLWRPLGNSGYLVWMPKAPLPAS